MPTPATMRVVQIEPGPWPILIVFAPQSARYSTPAAVVTLPAMMADLELGAEQFHGVAHAFAVTVRGGNGHGIHAAFHESADVREDAIAIQFTELGIARGADGGAADEAEVGVARRTELRLLFLVMRSTSFMVNKPCKMIFGRPRRAVCGCRGAR
jgi:hypothetical protein